MRLLLCFVVFGFTEIVIAQGKKKEFELLVPNHIISNSLYRSIGFIDSRDDTTNLGSVQTGALNHPTKVIAKIPLAIQVSKLLDSLISPNAKDGALLLQVRKFRFAELTNFSENGYCYFRAILYSKNEKYFLKLKSIDTVVKVESLGDVTKSLFKKTNRMITEFIASSLLRLPDDTTTYSISNIRNLDSIEKRKIVLYNTDTFKDGIYNSYSSFSSQLPDMGVTAVIEENKLKKVKAIHKNGKEEDRNENDIYAVVFLGIPYIHSDYGYYPLKKVNDNFYYIGKVKVNPKTSSVIGASLAFGVIGAAVVNANSTAMFELKLDYIKGNFIRVKEITK